MERENNMAGVNEFFELTGEGYNIMTRKANKFGKFQIDLVLTDPHEIKEAEKLEMKYGMKLKDSIKFATPDGLKELGGVTAVTLTAKFVDGGKYPRKFIPTTKSADGSVIEDLISHKAKITVRFKVFDYPAGDNYPAGHSFQLENVKVHEYTPYKSAA